MKEIKITLDEANTLLKTLNDIKGYGFITIEELAIKSKLERFIYETEEEKDKSSKVRKHNTKRKR